MFHLRDSSYRIFPAFVLLILFLVGPAAAGDIVLSVNSGTDSTVWFVSGEPSLVMNGFDLTPLNLQLPATIDRVSIAVNTPMPGASIDLLVYEDGNGGTPADARLVSQNQVDIRSSGTFTYEFPTPLIINQPVVWIGFYLPVDFRFLADTSGSSVLTYWGWTTGGRFSVNDLSTAQILGPADGSAPVNINLGGKARITAEISGSGTGSFAATLGSGNAPLVQLPGASQANLNIMQRYNEGGCDTVFRDVDDLNITYGGRLNTHCKLVWLGYAPTSPLGYARRQLLYEVTIYNDQGFVESNWIDAPITHCISPHPDDLNAAVIGLAYGSPQTWEILPSLRYGDLICAEIGRSGLISYFVPTPSGDASA
jgi:hypothetical protein